MSATSAAAVGFAAPSCSGLWGPAVVDVGFANEYEPSIFEKSIGGGFRRRGGPLVGMGNGVAGSALAWDVAAKLGVESPGLMSLAWLSDTGDGIRSRSCEFCVFLMGILNKGIGSDMAGHGKSEKDVGQRSGGLMVTARSDDDETKERGRR